MSWLQVTVHAPAALVPDVEAAFGDLEALSVTLGEAGEDRVLEPAPGESPVWEYTRVTGLFEASRDPLSLLNALSKEIPPGIAETMHLELLESREWERAWLDGFGPMRFGDRLWVCPTSAPSPKDSNACVIALDPGLAFGTGTHPTTALCLEWLDGADLAGLRIIDYGCGSGILAIAAAKLGAREVTAIDHDPQALLATEENAKRNSVAKRIAVRAADDIEVEAAEVVIANILAGTLIELRDKLCRLVKPGGRIVLSGILAEQSDAVCAAYRERLAITGIAQRDEWVRLDGIRPAASGDQEP